MTELDSHSHNSFPWYSEKLNLGLNEAFLDRTTWPQVTKEKEHITLDQNWNCMFQRITSKILKDNPQDRRQYLENHLSDNVIVSRTYKEFL